jgi:carboxyl-terminal processing protease
MKIRFIAAGAVLIGVASLVLAFKTYHKDDTPNRDKLIVSIVGMILKRGHYHAKPIDDAFSKEVFNKYLNDLDPQKNIFLQSDIDQLKQYQTQIDDEINTDEPLDFLHDANQLYDKRIKEVAAYYPEILSHPFDFNINESIQLDASKMDYPATEQAREERWRKFLKYKTLDQYVELQDLQEKAKKDSAGYKMKPDSTLQSEARADVRKSMDLYFQRLNTTFTNKERFSMFVNDITTTMDPHTEYFPPVDERYFDEQMSGTFYGIGALLEEDNGQIKIASIVTGGPAWKEGELKAGDIILKVGQGDKEPVDLAGYGTEDAVKIIRGDKGTVVKLTVKQTDGTIKAISITRGEVKLDATFAKSYIIKDGTHKIGIINLPEFYARFNDGKGASSSEDMKKEVDKLKADNVDGIIIDLRFDGGGSLNDAVNIAGLFIPQGPVVQVRSGDGTIQVLKDDDGVTDYSGPLAVMVNEYSASASEIFTAAMQDYKRAVIIGSPSTYGKGTVQRMLDLDDFYSGDLSAVGGSLGSLKLTIQKFYRITGGSTQLKGVTPDIILPDNYFNVGERTDSDALKWDHIAPADYTPWVNPVNTAYLEQASEARTDTSKVFHLINENIALLKKLENDQEYSLNIVKYREEEKENETAVNRMDELDKMVKKMNVSFLPVDVPYIEADSTRASIYRGLLKSYTDDPYLEETVHVLEDIPDEPAVKPNKLTQN